MLRSDLPELGAHLSADLSLHQLASDERNRLAHKIAVLASHHPGADISLIGLVIEPTSLDATVVGTTTRRHLHHFYRHDPAAVLVGAPSMAAASVSRAGGTHMMRR